MHDVISVRRAARTHRHWRTRTFLLSRECHCANLQMPTSSLKAPMSRLINGTSTQRCESTLPQYVFYFIFSFFLRPAQHITHAEPLIPGREKEKRKKKKKPLAWKSYKKKTSARCRATGGGPSRRTGAVALQAAGVKYLCVTDVFIAFSAPQPAGRGFSSSPRLIKSLHATHPFQPHPRSISIQRKQIRGGGWHLDIFGLRPASLIGPCNCRAVLFCVISFFYEVLFF